MKNLNFPDPYKTVLIHFMQEGIKTVMKGFYSNIDGYYNDKGDWIKTPKGIFHIPFSWIDDLPHGFKSYKKQPEEILFYEEINN